MKNKFDLVTLGLNAVDYICTVKKYPKEDVKINLDNFMKLPGGQAATAAVTASRLGFKSSYIGAVGDDDNGRFAIGELKKDNVDISGLKVRKESASQFAVIIVSEESGTRTILWKKGEKIKVNSEDINYSMIDNSKIFHCDGHNIETEIEVTDYCRKRGIKTVIDTENIVSQEIKKLLKNIDYIITPFYFADRLKETKFVSDIDRCKYLIDFGAKEVVLTKGSDGCVGYNGEEFYDVPAYKVKCKDTTGAGDVFHGAFISGLLFKFDFLTCLKFANFIAGIKCLKYGARTGIPGIEDLKGNYLEELLLYVGKVNL